MKQITDRRTLPQARNGFLAVAAVVALTFGVVSAFAQPAGGAPRGMHGDGAFEMTMPKLLGKAKASLNLNTQQQVQWDAIVAQGKAARQTAYTNRQQLKTALATELAKGEPDLTALAAVADSVEQQNHALRVAVRNQWLQFYATFSPEQKGVVRSAMQQRQTRMESFAAKMRARFQAAHPTAD